jgi:ABC-type multidrug transport system fused ATPase/permease subunit
LILTAILALGESLSMLAQSLLLRELVRWLQSAASDSVSETRGIGEGLGLAFGLAGLSLLQAVLHHVLYMHMMRMGWNMRIATMALVHDKLLRLSAATVSRFGNGKVVNLISTDVLR